MARVIYGSIIGLALVLALEEHPPSAGTTALLLTAGAVAIGLAEAYSEAVATWAQKRRPLNRGDTRRLAEESVAVVFGAGFPAAFFVLAAAGAIETDTAFTLSKWSGLGLICAYGFLASKLAGAGHGRAILHASAAGTIAGVLIAVKALLH
ncbi:MAG TPA: hypothetical protein VJT75_04580 [Thermoleophilaceae bacterium]|nr:hypothetical protein [Thermoleophilaceae bacterium]